jgi:hypothetical protein
MTYLVYWYGAKTPSDYYSFIPKSSFVPESDKRYEGLIQKLETAQAKVDSGEKAAAAAQELARKYKEMKKDLLKPREERKHVGHQEGYELLSMIDIDELEHPFSDEDESEDEGEGSSEDKAESPSPKKKGKASKAGGAQAKKKSKKKHDLAQVVQDGSGETLQDEPTTTKVGAVDGIDETGDGDEAPEEDNLPKPKAKASKVGSAKAQNISRKNEDQAEAVQDKRVGSVGGIDDIGDSNEPSEEEGSFDTKAKASKTASSNKKKAKKEDQTEVRYDEDDQSGFSVEREDKGRSEKELESKPNPKKRGKASTEGGDDQAELESQASKKKKLWLCAAHKISPEQKKHDLAQVVQDGSGETLQDEPTTTKVGAVDGIDETGDGDEAPEEDNLPKPKAKASKVGSAKAKNKSRENEDQAEAVQDKPVGSVGGIDDIGDSNEPSGEEGSFDTKAKASKTASSNKKKAKKEDQTEVRYDEDDQSGFSVEREDKGRSEKELESKPNPKKRGKASTEGGDDQAELESQASKKKLWLRAAHEISPEQVSEKSIAQSKHQTVPSFVEESNPDGKQISEQERKKIMNQVPVEAKKMFGDIAFVRWGESIRPVLVVNPFEVPVEIRTEWLAMLKKVSALVSDYFSLFHSTALTHLRLLTAEERKATRRSDVPSVQIWEQQPRRVLCYCSKV